MGKEPSHFFLKGILGLLFSMVFMGVGGGLLWAGEKEDMAAMQKALNQEVLDRPFNPGDKAAVDAYLENAIKKGVKPNDTRPQGWAPGWTCNNLVYSYRAYRDCRYYHRYHGRYYPY
jgi:hypothetical protein